MKVLTKFKVKNYLSFSEKPDGKPIEFNMWQGELDGKNSHVVDYRGFKILNFSAIYGANAAGKSNWVKAMSFMQQAVLGHLSIFPGDNFCKTDDANRNKSSYFEVEIVVDGKIYAYGFEILFSEGRYTAEWLFELSPDGNERMIFTRDVDTGKTEWCRDIMQSFARERMLIYAEDIDDRPDALLLRVIGSMKNALCEKEPSLLSMKQCFEWIRDSWNITRPEQPITNYSYILSTGKWRSLERLIRYFDFDIVEVLHKNVEIGKILLGLPEEWRKQIRDNINRIMKAVTLSGNDMKYNSNVIAIRSNSRFYLIIVRHDRSISYQEITFRHKYNNSEYLAAEESDGTMRMLDLLEVFLSDSGRTFVIDELDRCLHPELTYKFVQTFLEQCSGKNKQLIVTTHEIHLLSSNFLRRDEVWFVEKNEYGNTELYSLNRYKSRFDKHLEDAYMEGRYGGVPVFEYGFPEDGN